MPPPGRRARTLADIKRNAGIVLAGGAVAAFPDAPEGVADRDAGAVTAAGQVPGFHGGGCGSKARWPGWRRGIPARSAWCRSHTASGRKGQGPGKPGTAGCRRHRRRALAWWASSLKRSMGFRVCAAAARASQVASSTRPSGRRSTASWNASSAWTVAASRKPVSATKAAPGQLAATALSQLCSVCTAGPAAAGRKRVAGPDACRPRGGRARRDRKQRRSGPGKRLPVGGVHHTGHRQPKRGLGRAQGGFGFGVKGFAGAGSAQVGAATGPGNPAAGAARPRLRRFRRAAAPKPAPAAGKAAPPGPLAESRMALS